MQPPAPGAFFHAARMNTGRKPFILRQLLYNGINERNQPMQTIHVTASREYDCLLGSGLLDRAGELIRSDLVSRRGAASAHKCRRICVVSDQNVSDLYGQEDHALIRSLKSAGFEISRFVFPGGEAHKNLQTVEALLDHLSENRFTRSDILAALGGGITGDITGFAAAVYQRGIEFVQIPTSLLAAVDSSVGGKTGVNLKAGKNLAGAFWQPNLVLFDPAVLATLSEELLLDGMAEILKAGFITDEGLLQDALALIGGPQKQDSPALIGGPQKQDGPARSLKTCEPDAFVPLIGRAIDIKRKIVEEDERESGSRKLLNLGHTLAHAIDQLIRIHHFPWGRGRHGNRHDCKSGGRARLVRTRMRG